MIANSALPPNTCCMFIRTGCELPISCEDCCCCAKHCKCEKIDPREGIADQEILELIERICGDDFCEDISIRFHEMPPGDLRTAAEKLLLIYRVAHSSVRSHSCYRNHEDWRAEAERLAKEEEK